MQELDNGFSFVDSCNISNHLRYGHIGTLNRGVGMGPQGFMNPGHGTLGRPQPKPINPTYST